MPVYAGFLKPVPDATKNKTATRVQPIIPNRGVKARASERCRFRTLDKHEALRKVATMAQQEDRGLAAELRDMLIPHFPGITVDVAYSARWDRMCATFRHEGFADCLPEERFHRLVAVIPEELRNARLEGFVWLELTPDESIEQFLKLPRSEDVAERQDEVLTYLQKLNFFERLAGSLGPTPSKSCLGGFSQSTAILASKDCPQAAIRDAKLVFIRAGAYCDCQALVVGRDALKDARAGAA